MFATRARRFCYAIASLLLGAELFNVWHFPAVDWYANAVVQAATFGAVCWTALAGALELIALRARSARAQWFLLTYAALPLYWTFCECLAMWTSRDTADFQTWHLIALFTVVHFVQALVLATIIVGLSALVIFVRNYRGPRNDTGR